MREIKKRRRRMKSRMNSRDLVIDSVDASFIKLQG